MHAIGRIPGEGRLRALAAAVLAVLLFAASPASAVTVQAPVLSATSDWCTATLTWTHSNPANLNIYTFQYRTSTDSGANWSSWTNISGGGSARSTTLSRATGGSIVFQVRAIAHTLGASYRSGPSNSVTVQMLSSSHIQCMARQ